MTIYNDLRMRLESFSDDEKGEFTETIITALIAADNMIRALDNFNDDVALFRNEPKETFRLEVSRSWDDFSACAKHTAEMLQKENFNKKIHDKG